MGDGPKKICKLAKKDYLKENLEEFSKLVNDPHYICRKCGHVCNTSGRLCKEAPLPGE